VVTTRVQALGVEHDATQVAQDRLVRMLVGAGRVEEAIEHLREVVTTRVQALGVEHDATQVAQD